jgi:hypothetical protein
MAAALDAGPPRMPADRPRLSSDSRRLIAGPSGHDVQLDQPEAAVGAIRTTVEEVRRPARR